LFNFPYLGCAAVALRTVLVLRSTVPLANITEPAKKYSGK
jgi:hypothetical protein